MADSPNSSGKQKKKKKAQTFDVDIGDENNMNSQNGKTSASPNGSGAKANTKRSGKKKSSLQAAFEKFRKLRQVSFAKYSLFYVGVLLLSVSVNLVKS